MRLWLQSCHSLLIVTTDFTKHNGTGGESIYGGHFSDEDLSRPLDSEGCASSILPRIMTLISEFL